jgi:HJR/Mrr/RecB family endonuclease
MRTTHIFKRLHTLAATALITTALIGCGGGGGGGGGTTATTTPTLTLTPQGVKTFHFSWADVAGETGYRLLENPDGVSGYTEVATIAADATSYDLEVFLPGRVNASYMLQVCDAGGCTDHAEVAVSGTLVEAVGYVKASNTQEDDTFGAIAISADGNTLAVGAQGEDSAAIGIGGDQADNTASNSGAVYLFTRNGGLWAQKAYLKASNSEASDRFGGEVALSDDGNTLAVGAYLEDSDATGINGQQDNNNASNSGAVYVFLRGNLEGDQWSQQAYIKASNTGSGDFFGGAIALSADGNTLAVGAKGEGSAVAGIDTAGAEADNSASGSGALYLFTRSSAVWSQQAYIKASNPEKNDDFGSDVALSDDGNTLAVAAIGEDSAADGIDAVGAQADNTAANSGAVYLFTRSSNVWSQQAYIKASNSEASDYFSQVALSGDGNTLAVGAWTEDSSATGIGGDQADNMASDSGAVYLFTRSSGVWSQQAYIKASNSEAADHFGGALALSADGSMLGVTSSGESGNGRGINGDQSDNSATYSGAAYLFTRSTGGVWSQQAYIKAPNSEENDTFGDLFALSADGGTLVVSGFGESSSATGIGGDQADNTAPYSGAVYLY